MEIYFLYPSFLLFLLFVPLAILIYFLSTIYPYRKSINFPNFHAMSRISDVEIFSKNFLSLYLNIGAIIFIVLALAGLSISFQSEVGSFIYVFAIDTSSSMGTTDVHSTRLVAAKDFAKDFVTRLPTVPIGVVSFSGDAQIIQGLESSKLLVRAAIDSVDYGVVQGTNVYDAIVAANSVFGASTLKSVILISDGQSNVEDAAKIIDYSKRRNIVVHTVAVGTSEGGETPFGTISKVNEDYLKALALNTGGKFFKISDEPGFDEVLFGLADESTGTVHLNLSTYMLVIGLLFIVTNWGLINFRFKIIP